MNIKQQAIDITRLFFLHIKKVEPNVQGKFNIPNKYKADRIAECLSLLSGGHTRQEIEHAIHTVAMEDDSVSIYDFSEVLKCVSITPQYGKIEEDETNLLTFGKFYFHPHLQVTSAPMRMRFDDYGNVEMIAEPFFLEMRPSLTLEELHDYFNKKIPVGPYSPQMKGSWEYLLKSYDVEMLLFMIDQAYDEYCQLDNPAPFNPLRLSDYAHKGRELFFIRKQTSFEGGIDHVIPRQG